MQYCPLEERDGVKTKGHLSVVIFVAFDYIRFKKIFIFFENLPNL